MTAVLTTSTGKTARVPHFVLGCPNCRSPLHVRAAASTDGVPRITLSLCCTAGCGVSGQHAIEVGP